MKRHILTREDFDDFVVEQIMGSDSDRGKRLIAVWDLSRNAGNKPFFSLRRYNGKAYVQTDIYADMDAAIAAYNDI